MSKRNPINTMTVTPSASPLAGAAKTIDIKPKVPEWLFADNPGISITGTSGSGKSNALEILLREVIASRLQPGLLFIDPHGTSAVKLHRWCLAQGNPITSRLLYLHFASAAKIPNIDVLHVPGADVGSLAWYGRLSVIVELVSKILLAAWGETDFNSKPILFKNCYRVLYTLAHAGLSLADAELFLNIADPIYTTLCQAVPDVIPTARSEMEELVDLRPADRIAQLESCKNRTLGLLSNPIVKAILGRTAADGALTMEHLYDSRAIVIVNLETGGVLRTMDQEILANVLLTLCIFTAMNTPEHRRHLQILAVDELPVFRSSADLLTNIALPQTRKYLLRTIACFQGANAFTEKTEDRLLQAFLGLCGTRLYFRHNSEADCAFFGRAVSMPTYSPLVVKYEHRQPMQFTEGNELVVLTDTSDSTSDGNTEGSSQGTSSTRTDTVSEAAAATNTAVRSETRDDDLFRLTVSEARAEANSKQAGRSQATGATKQDTMSQSHTRTSSHGVTRKQQLVPIIRTRDIVTSVTFYTKEELDAVAAAIIANLPVGQAILHMAGATPARVTFPLAVDPYARSPKFALRKVLDHRMIQDAQPAFATIEEIEEQRRLLLSALLRRLSTMAHGEVPNAMIHLQPDDVVVRPPQAGGDMTF